MSRGTLTFLSFSSLKRRSRSCKTDRSHHSLNQVAEGRCDRFFHCEPWGVGDRKSPDRLYGILKDRMIDRDNRNVLNLSLCNQNSVKGIFMMIGKSIHLKNVGKVDR